MTGILRCLFPCISHRKPWMRDYQNSIPPHDNEKTVYLTSEEAAGKIVTALFEAREGGSRFKGHINGIVHQAGGWSEWLAKKILEGIEAALIAEKGMDALLGAAYDKACEAATVFEKFSKDHPLATAVFVTVIAIGILVVVAPYLLELLGFGEIGIIEGSWAATWQSAFRGFVPKGSLFSFLQRLGMTLKWNLGS